MGKWVTFIRFAGCNLQCPFCDEKSKYDKAIDMSIEDIVARVGTQHVVLTGGEPTLQTQLYALCDALHRTGHYISIETNGTKSVDKHYVDWVTVSPKGPDYVINTVYDELKFVVTEDIDYNKILDITSKVYHAYGSKLIWLQPCDGPNIEESKKRIIDICKGRGATVRAGIQLHKYYDIT